MINMLMCGNSGVLDGMILTVLSLVKYSREPVNLYIGTMSLTDVDERFTPVTEERAALVETLLKEGNPESRVTLWDVGESFRREMLESKNMKSAYTPYAMIRLFANELGVEDKLLYVDTDVLFLGDVAELYGINIEDYHLAGVKDYYGHIFISARYLNSGVMLWNMKTMRRDGVFERCRRLCVRRKMLLADQSAINKYAKKKLILKRRFNEQHGVFPDTLIQHFSMRIKWFPYIRTESVKPWNYDLIHEKWNLHIHDDVIDRWIKIKEKGYCV